MKFLTDLYKENEANVMVFGVETNKASKRSIDSIRKASFFIEPFDIAKEKLVGKDKNI